MHWQYTPYTTLIFIAAIISGVLTLWGWRRRPASGAGWFTALMLSACFWASFYVLEMVSTDLPATLLWSKMQYFGAVGLPVAWLALVLTYTGQRRWLSPRNVALLFVIPLITLALVWTNGRYELIWVNPGLETGVPFNTLSFTPGMWYWVNIAYAYALFVFSTILLVATLTRATPLYRQQIIILLIFSLTTWIGNLAYTVGLTPHRMNLTPVTFSVSGLLVAWGLFRYRILDVAPVARDVIIESMSDGVIVLDPQSRVVDLNPMAQTLIGHTLSEVIGQPFAQVLAGWPALVEQCRGTETVHSEIALGTGEGRHIFDLRLSPLHDRRGRLAGRLMILRDITERKQAEDKLRQLSRAVEQSDSTIVITDLDGNIEFVNPAFSRITGYSYEEAIGQNPRMLKSGKHPHELYQDLWATISKGEVWRGEFINKKRNGELYWEIATISPVKDEFGEITHYLAIKDDITERKRVEAALRESEERFRSVAQSANDAIIMADSNGNIVSWNKGAQTIFGYREEEVLGQPLSLLMPDRYKQAHQQGMERLRSTGESRVIGTTVELDGRRKDGDEFSLDIALSSWQTGGETFYSAIIRDITDRKRAEEALALAHEQALEANHLKSRLLANVSHDLRSPLGSILGYTEMLQAGIYGPLAGQQYAALTEIIDSTEQLLNFASNLLGQAQIESGKVVLNVRPFAPADLLEAIQSTAKALAQAKGLEVISKVAPDMPTTLSGDLYWLRQILVNLVSNAVKFTDQGTVKVHIYQSDENYWAIQVSDTGCGIPAEAQSYIFEPFRQVDGAATRKQHIGSGLGLSIVKQLTALMGGQVTLTSEVGQGSVFTVLLPLIPVQEEAA